MSYITQSEINQREDEFVSIRLDTRLMREMYPACWMCGCIENGTIEYEDEVVNCHVCNGGEGMNVSR